MSESDTDEGLASEERTRASLTPFYSWLTREDSNRRSRELSWLAAGHKVHLPGSTAASLLKPSILW